MSNLAVLYDVQWQKLRVSLLAEHKRDGGFTTVTGTTRNIEKLNKYVEEALDDPNDHALRVYRVLNLLNAVRMGYSGQGLKGTPQDDLVRRTRESYSHDHIQSSRLVGLQAAQWDWTKVDMDLARLCVNDQLWFERIYRNLKDRLTTGAKRRGDRNDVNVTRKELVTFVELMEDYR